MIQTEIPTGLQAKTMTLLDKMHRLEKYSLGAKVLHRRGNSNERVKIPTRSSTEEHDFHGLILSRVSTFLRANVAKIRYMMEEMDKDFDRWNKVKKKTNAEEPRLYTVREMWWCRLGVNIGTEQDGRGEWYVRPCVILRGFGQDACLVAPLTTSTRDHPLRVSVGMVEGRSARANLSQVRVVDTRRLERKIGFLEKEILKRIGKAARGLL